MSAKEKKQIISKAKCIRPHDLGLIHAMLLGKKDKSCSMSCRQVNRNSQLYKLMRNEYTQIPSIEKGSPNLILEGMSDKVLRDMLRGCKTYNSDTKTYTSIEDKFEALRFDNYTNRLPKDHKALYEGMSAKQKSEFVLKQIEVYNKQKGVKPIKLRTHV